MSKPGETRRERVVPGDQVGKFRVERIIGQGGMGVVVEATNAQLDQRVAIKLLAPGKATSESSLAFLNEARTAVRLKSDHVARIQDVDVDPVHGPYIVMELLEGSSLAEVLADGKRLSVRRAVEYVIDACEGLAEAHVRGIVHQDIKPANLFVSIGNDGHPSVKVLDFGIAKMRQSALNGSGALDLRMSTTGASHGTPFYLSPEQLRADSGSDHRADIWALGCVLFELIVGEKAFFTTRYTELVVKILEAPRAEVPEGIDVPASLVDVIDRCLEKDPAKRFASTGELALALLPFARRRAHSVTTRAVTRVRDGGLDPHLSMPSSMPPRPSDTNVDLVSSQSLRAPPVPRVSLGPSEPPPPPSLRRPLAALAVVVFAAAGLLVVYLAGRVERAASENATAEPPTGAVLLPLERAPSALPSALPSATKATGLTPVLVAPPPSSLAPRPAQAAPTSTATALVEPPPSAAPRAPDSEIRMKR